jgi:hypothetical protein
MHDARLADWRKAGYRAPFAGLNRIRFQGSVLNPTFEGIPLAVKP